MSPKTAQMVRAAGGLLVTASGPFVFRMAGLTKTANHAAYMVMAILYCLGGWTVADLLVKLVLRLGPGRSKS